MAKLMFLPPIKIDRFEVLISQIYYVSKSRNRLEIGTCRKSRKGVGTHVFFYQGSGPMDGWGKTNLKGEGLDTRDGTIYYLHDEEYQVFLPKSDVRLLILQRVFSIWNSNFNYSSRMMFRFVWYGAFLTWIWLKYKLGLCVFIISHVRVIMNLLSLFAILSINSLLQTGVIFEESEWLQQDSNPQPHSL